MISRSIKSRNFEKFTNSKISKIRNKLVTSSIRLNLINFQSHFLRKFQNWFQIFDTCNIHEETISLSIKSRDFEKFRVNKIWKIRNKLITNPIRTNYMSFKLHFLRKFQNWFYIFDTSNIYRKTISLSIKFRDFEKIRIKKVWKIRNKLVASSIRLNLMTFQFHF